MANKIAQTVQATAFLRVAIATRGERTTRTNNALIYQNGTRNGGSSRLSPTTRAMEATGFLSAR